jgi:hypothetical protein
MLPASPSRTRSRNGRRVRAFQRAVGRPTPSGRPRSAAEQPAHARPRHVRWDLPGSRPGAGASFFPRRPMNRGRRCSAPSARPSTGRRAAGARLSGAPRGPGGTGGSDYRVGRGRARGRVPRARGRPGGPPRSTARPIQGRRRRGRSSVWPAPAPVRPQPRRIVRRRGRALTFTLRRGRGANGRSFAAGARPPAHELTLLGRAESTGGGPVGRFELAGTSVRGHGARSRELPGSPPTARAPSC